LAAGLTLAIAMTIVMSHALYNVVAVEPLTFVVLTALLAGAALLAGYIPAYRAARLIRWRRCGMSSAAVAHALVRAAFTLL